MIYRDDVLLVPFTRQANKGTLMAISANDGKIIWKFQDDIKKSSFFHYPPLINDQSCFITDYGDNIYRLDMKSGRLQWRYVYRGDEYPKLCFQGRNYFAISSDDDYHAYLFFINKETGKEIDRYTFRTTKGMERFVTEVKVDGNFLILSLGDGTYCAFEGSGK